MTTVSVEANNVRNGVSAARKALNLNPRKPDSKIKYHSEDGDGLHRITLNTGDVIEVTVKRHARAVVNIQPD